MIGKQFKARSFSECVGYVLGKQKSELIGGNIFSDKIPEILQEFERTTQKNYKVRRPVYHCSLSLPLGTQLGNSTWSQLASQYLDAMGFTANQYIVVRHTDQPHDHVHLVVNRVRIDTYRVVSDSWDYRRSEAILRQLEEAFSLPPQISSVLRDTRQPTRRQIEKHKVTGQPTIKHQLQTQLDQVLTQTSKGTILNLLKSLEIDIKLTHNKTGHPIGIIYSYQGMHFSGTQLGPGYTYPAIAHQFPEQFIQPLSSDELNHLKEILHSTVRAAVSFSNWQLLLRLHGVEASLKTRGKNERVLYRIGHQCIFDNELGKDFSPNKIRQSFTQKSDAETLYQQLATTIRLQTTSTVSDVEIDKTIMDRALEHNNQKILAALSASPALVSAAKNGGQQGALEYLHSLLTQSKTPTSSPREHQQNH